MGSRHSPLGSAGQRVENLTPGRLKPQWGLALVESARPRIAATIVGPKNLQARSTMQNTTKKPICARHRRASAAPKTRGFTNSPRMLRTRRLGVKAVATAPTAKGCKRSTGRLRRRRRARPQAANRIYEPENCGETGVFRAAARSRVILGRPAMSYHGPDGPFWGELERWAAGGTRDWYFCTPTHRY